MFRGAYDGGLVVLDNDTSWLQLIPQIMCPLLRRSLWQRSKRSYEHDMLAKNVFNAVALSIALGRSERRSAATLMQPSKRVAQAYKTRESTVAPPRRPSTLLERSSSRLKKAGRFMTFLRKGCASRGAVRSGALFRTSSTIEQKDDVAGPRLRRVSMAAARPRCKRLSESPCRRLSESSDPPGIRHAVGASKQESTRLLVDVPSFVDEVSQKLVSFYSIPQVRLVARGISHTFFYCYIQFGLIIHLVQKNDIFAVYPGVPLKVSWDDRGAPAQRPAWYLPSDSDKRDFYVYYSMWIFCEAARWADGLLQYSTNKRKHLTDRFQPMEVASTLSSVVVIVSHVGFELVTDPRANPDAFLAWYDAFMISFSIQIIMSTLLWLRFVSTYEPLGVLTIILQKMLTDLLTFLLLFLVITLAFTLALEVHYKANFIKQVEERFGPVHPTGHLWIPLWSVFGHFEPELYDPISAAFVWIYILLSSVRAREQRTEALGSTLPSSMAYASGDIK